MLLHLPRLLFTIIREHFILKKIIKEHNIDIVISDNRYGLWNKKVKTIFITHQVIIKMPSLLQVYEKLVYKINSHFINKYTECWVPDITGEGGITGELSNKYDLKIKKTFIGRLSRFNNNSIQRKESYDNDFLAILSGPEPQRTIFENILIDHFKNKEYKVLIVRGLAGITNNMERKGNIELINYQGTEHLLKSIQNSKIIISRSGYSSIMDYLSLKINALLVPIPGQTEHEYLASRLKEKKIYYSMNQNEFDIEKALEQMKLYSIENAQGEIDSNILLKQAIASLRE